MASLETELEGYVPYEFKRGYISDVRVRDTSAELSEYQYDPRLPIYRIAVEYRLSHPQAVRASRRWSVFRRALFIGSLASFVMFTTARAESPIYESLGVTRERSESFQKQIPFWSLFVGGMVGALHARRAYTRGR